MVRQIAVDVLLGLAVVVALASALGVALMPDVYQKLHYVTPLATVAPVLVGLAILVQSGWTAVAAQTWLTVIFVVMAGPVVSHATIRAAKIRADGDWRARSQPGAHLATAADDAACCRRVCRRAFGGCANALYSPASADGCAPGSAADPGCCRGDGGGSDQGTGAADSCAERLRLVAGGAFPRLPGAGRDALRTCGRRGGSANSASSRADQSATAGETTPALRRGQFLLGIAGFLAF